MSAIREVIGDDLTVSVSQIKTFMKCPRMFELRYIRGTDPDFIPKPLAFGIAFHGALARYYVDVRDLGVGPPVEKLIQTFTDLWEQRKAGPIPIQGVDDEEEAKVDPVDLAAKMLRRFHEQAALPADTSVEAVEFPFSFPLHDPDTGEVLDEKLVGVIDLVLQEDGHGVVVEHKSSAKKYGYDQLHYDIQLTAYQLAMREQGWQDVGLRFQIVTKTKSPHVQIENVMRSLQDEDDFRRLASGVLKAIDAGVNYPVRSWACKSCPYRSVCPQFGRPKPVGLRSLTIVEPQRHAA